MPPGDQSSSEEEFQGLPPSHPTPKSPPLFTAQPILEVRKSEGDSALEDEDEDDEDDAGVGFSRFKGSIERKKGLAPAALPPIIEATVIDSEISLVAPLAAGMRDKLDALSATYLSTLNDPKPQLKREAVPSARRLRDIRRRIANLKAFLVPQVTEIDRNVLTPFWTERRGTRDADDAVEREVDEVVNFLVGGGSAGNQNEEVREAAGMSRAANILMGLPLSHQSSRMDVEEGLVERLRKGRFKETDPSWLQSVVTALLAAPTTEAKILALSRLIQGRFRVGINALNTSLAQVKPMLLCESHSIDIFKDLVTTESMITTVLENERRLRELSWYCTAIAQITTELASAINSPFHPPQSQEDSAEALNERLRRLERESRDVEACIERQDARVMEIVHKVQRMNSAYALLLSMKT